MLTFYRDFTILLQFQGQSIKKPEYDIFGVFPTNWVHDEYGSIYIQFERRGKL